MSEFIVPEMLTLREASQRSGLAYEHLRKLCIRNEIVHIRTGTRYLVNLPKLIDYLNGGDQRG